jgi:hypothetical protein
MAGGASLYHTITKIRGGHFKLRKGNRRASGLLGVLTVARGFPWPEEKISDRVACAREIQGRVADCEGGGSGTAGHGIIYYIKISRNK